MMVDANTANPVIGNATHPLIHWLVTNIRDGTVSTGRSTCEPDRSAKGFVVVKDPLVSRHI